MKKFKFSLQKLLMYKEQIKDIERGALLELVSSKNILTEKLSNLQNEEIKTKNKIVDTMAKGANFKDINTLNFIIENCRTQIHFLKRDIAILETQIEKQQQVVAEVSKEVQAIEKLKEKKVFEYEQTVLKEQNKIVEEYVSKKAFDSLNEND